MVPEMSISGFGGNFQLLLVAMARMTNCLKNLEIDIF